MNPRLLLLPTFALAALACTRNSVSAGPGPKKDSSAEREPDAAAVGRDASAAAPDAGGAFPIRVIGGSRLKAMYARTADGEKYFLYTYFDTTLQIPCFFNVAQDGKTRCLPQGHQKPLRFFNDQSCTQ